jgi:uncharacterized protein (TIGR02646 family)
MRFIQKRQEPSEFATWKQTGKADWQPNWDDFQQPEKIIVHDALLEEQGHICCYCEQFIKRVYEEYELPASHIEHFQPRTHYPELSLSYGNFLASCQGYLTLVKDEKTSLRLPQEFCGSKKGAKTDVISPLDRDCASYFRYTAMGEIRSTKELQKSERAEATIKRLDLNNVALRKAREGVIDGVLKDIESETTERIQRLIDGFDRPDSSGKFTPFCTAIIYRLQDELNLRQRLSLSQF